MIYGFLRENQIFSSCAKTRPIAPKKGNGRATRFFLTEKTAILEPRAFGRLDAKTAENRSFTEFPTRRPGRASQRARRAIDTHNTGSDITRILSRLRPLIVKAKRLPL